MLEQIQHWNDLSPELRAKLEKAVDGFGKTARFKFDISHLNPDPQKYNGPVLWPARYVLDPKTFRINDVHETRKDRTKSKLVGLITKLNEKGFPDQFEKIIVTDRQKGILTLNLENTDEREKTMYLLMHPKLKDGEFYDKNRIPVFEFVDDKKIIAERKAERDAREKALITAQEMTDEQVIQYSGKYGFDTTKDILLVRIDIEDFAEANSTEFNENIKELFGKKQAILSK